jgi:hypothetical protein
VDRISFIRARERLDSPVPSNPGQLRHTRRGKFGAQKGLKATHCVAPA